MKTEDLPVDQRGADLQAPARHEGRAPLPQRPVADLVVVLEAAGQAGGRQPTEGPSVAAVAERGPLPAEDIALLQRPRHLL